MTTAITSNASDAVLKINGADAVKFNTGGVTSLGTIILPNAWTGQVVIKRIL